MSERIIGYLIEKNYRMEIPFLVLENDKKMLAYRIPYFDINLTRCLFYAACSIFNK